MAMATVILLLSLLALLSHCTSDTTPTAPATAVGDTAALILFRDSTDAHGNLAANWTTADACTGGWVGVTCWSKRVVSLSLPSLDLRGSIDTLSHLDQLRVLDLHSNRLNGTLSAISSLQNLKLLYLSRNDFSGEIPPAIGQLTRLLRVDLSNNNLRGPIPGDAVANLTLLLTFRVQDNLLSGLLPDLSTILPRLVEFNASNNQLSGRVPDGMHAKFGIKSFAGNGGLCGPFSPLPLCSFIPHEPPPSIVASLSPSSQSVVPSNPASASSSINSNGPKMPVANTEKGGLSKGAIIGIVVGNIAFLLLILSLLTVYCCCSNDALSNKHTKGNRADSEGGENQKGEQSMGAIGRFSDGGESDGAQSKLVFFGLEGDEEEGSDSSCEKRMATSGPKKGRKFELEQLLRASAEMVGKGSLGTVYRAVLEDGRMVAVKRLRDTNPCPSKDFYRYMDLIGRLRHPNLVRLRAFYYAKQEKLLIYDFLPNGTLHSGIHANRGPGRVPLDWTARFRLLLGAARGLAWIHLEYSVSGIPHGNIKSSNILIRENHDACIADFGLSLLLSPAHAVARLGGYMAPEQDHSKRLSQEADVYSFGVLILEVLTGRVPTQCPPPLADSTSQKKHNKSVGGVASVDAADVGLVEWVRLVVREEWTAEVFDVELLRYKDIEEEMVSMLHVGLACVNQLPENRPTMSEVVKLIEGIRVEYQSTLSPSIAAMTDDCDAVSC